MEDTRVFNIPDGNSNFAETMALMNGCGGNNNMWNNPIWALVFLAVLGRNNGLFGGNDNNCQLSQIQDTLNTNQGNTLLMDAIKGNGCAISQLASTINCDFNSVNSAINAVQSSICNVGNQVGMSSQSVINAINNGNMSLTNTLQSCCCDIRENVTRMGYENQINNLNQTNVLQNAINGVSVNQEKGFNAVAYETAQQTCAIQNGMRDNTAAIIAKLDSIEDARKDREINTLTAQLASANARAERQAELAPLYQKINDITCKLPQTVTLPYSCATAVPTASVFGGYNPFGIYNNGSIWS